MFWTQCVTDGRTLTQCLINTPILFVWSRCEKSSSSLITTRRNIQRLWSVNLWLSLIILRKYVMFRFWSDEQKDLVWIHIHMNQGGGVFSERSALVLAAVSDRTGVFSLLGFFLWQTFNWPWICTESESPRSELRADLKGHQKEKLNVSPQSCFAEAAAAAAHTAVWSSIWIHVDAVKVW